MDTKKPRCTGKRRQFRRGAYGIFRCMKRATGTMETHVGFTEHHHVCDDESCQHSVSAGYPASFTPFK